MIGDFGEICENRVKLGELCLWGMDLCVMGGVGPVFGIDLGLW